MNRKMNKELMGIILVLMMFMTVIAPVVAQPIPFLISGDVFYSNGDPYNSPWIQITNMNTGSSWDAENSSTSNYYQLVPTSGDVNVNDVLQLEASGGSQSKTVEHTVTQDEINAGGFTEGITLEEAPVYFELTMSIDGSGSTDPAAGTTHTYPAGTIVDVSATPDAGWQFDSWSGDLLGSETPTTITMDSGKSVTAHFSEILTPRPDLITTGIITPVRLRADVINPVTATVENIGSAESESFDVTLDVDGVLVDTVTVTSLAAGEDTTVEFLWIPYETGIKTLTVTADANDDVKESDKSNNDLPGDVDILETLTTTVNVRIEGKDSTIWTGDVTFSSSSITATSGKTCYYNEPTALGALDEADKIAGFGYVADDSWGFVYISEIAGEPPIGWDGWMYRVDYVSPMVGAGEFTLYGGEDVLWYFGAYGAPPLKIDLDKTTVDIVEIGEEFTAVVTAYNDSEALFDPVENAEVYVDDVFYGLTEADGTLLMSLEVSGTYQIHADKGTWADCTRSERKAVTVLSEGTEESYGERVNKSYRVSYPDRALHEPDNVGAVIRKKGKIGMELNGTVKDCKNVSVWVAARRRSKFNVYVSEDGTNWTKIGSGICKSKQYRQYDYTGEFGDVKYIGYTRTDRGGRRSIMLLDAVHAES